MIETCAYSELLEQGGVGDAQLLRNAEFLKHVMQKVLGNVRRRERKEEGQELRRLQVRAHYIPDEAGIVLWRSLSGFDGLKVNTVCEFGHVLGKEGFDRGS